MIDKTYQPCDVEGRIYQTWEQAGAFRAGRPERAGAQPYSIVIPPPNVTGSLHMGHALNNTLQDILVRFERMRGKDVLWQPGTDHAGIATQMVVERQLMERQEPGRREMGREEFLKRSGSGRRRPAAPSSISSSAWARRATGRASASPWTRACRKAVLKVFVELYSEGLIYKDKRLVNWDPKLLTAISDLEVVQVETKGHLWHLRYPIEGKTFDPKTRRPSSSSPPRGRRRCWATPRWRCIRTTSATRTLVGKNVILPLVGRKFRSLPTNIPIRRRARARSRSRRRTTSTISRSASGTICRRSISSASRPSSTLKDNERFLAGVAEIRRSRRDAGDARA